MTKLCVALIVVGCRLVVYAQGTVWFINLDSQHGVDAPVYQADGITKLDGPQFMAELLAGPTAGSLSSVATTGFLGGLGAGYFNGGVRTINSVSPGQTAWIEVRAWNTITGASFTQAQISGLPNSWWTSPVFSVITGGLPSSSGDTPPGFLTGLGSSPALLNPVPEPSGIALMGLGSLGAFLLSGRSLLRPSKFSGSKSQ